ncbi:SMP-30/gluconolactonase/LRE family protein [Mycobacterium sp. WMMD1722]|uniref:SMP-30/gluconolactonase/LRE family protein n=1 Tax=Mycobacterium sp. WMMD1722 TaxID=3404117 RepID=UPI003BF5E9F6
MATSLQQARYAPENAPALAAGWELHRVTAPSRLFGANGLRTGPDGRMYIAQVTGSQISAIDVGTGVIEAISPKGGDIVAPDDLAFDGDGNLYATEYFDGRVSVREPSGRTRVLRDDLPAANGITVHRGRLFVNECREGGRLMELDPAGGAPRVLLENLAGPNAMEVGPDGLLYYPLMMANEIWRVNPDQEGPCEPQRVAAELGAPDAVKFDADGFIVSTQVASGQVLRIDPRTGAQTVLAQLNPGLDNLTIVDGRLFASNFTGEITEVLAGGGTRALLPGGLNWPHDLAIGGDGRLYIADGTYFYAVAADGALETVAMLFTPGYPGYLRGLAATGAGDFLVTTSLGQVGRYRPGGETDYLATGFDQLYGIAVGSDDTAVFAELGAGRVHALRGGATEVLATGLAEPSGVAFGPDGAPLVTEAAGGRVVRLAGGRAETMADGLDQPQGILVDGTTAFVVDAGAKAVVAVDLGTGTRETIASGLPIGAPPGVTPKPLRGIPPFSGPQGPFAGITRAPDGTLYVAADGDGSVLALRRA